MKKKTVKKLVLSKETVLELTGDLRRAMGGWPSETYNSVSVCPYNCDALDTAHPTCIA